MPCDMTLYPKNWPLFRGAIRQRSGGRCECTGQCGLHRRIRCTETQHTPARFAKGTIRLTIAHTCNCNPPCAHPSHVMDACQRCHLRIDRFKHALARLATQRARKYAPEGPRMHANTHPLPPVPPKTPPF